MKSIQTDMLKLNSGGTSGKKPAGWFHMTMALYSTKNLWLQVLQFVLNLQDNSSGGFAKYNHQVTLNQGMKTDLMWWTTLLQKLSPVPVCPPQSDLIIELGASNMGWGARCVQTSMGGAGLQQK